MSLNRSTPAAQGWSFYNAMQQANVAYERLLGSGTVAARRSDPEPVTSKRYHSVTWCSTDRFLLMHSWTNGERRVRAVCLVHAFRRCHPPTAVAPRAVVHIAAVFVMPVSLTIHGRGSTRAVVGQRGRNWRLRLCRFSGAVALERATSGPGLAMIGHPNSARNLPAQASIPAA